MPYVATTPPTRHRQDEGWARRVDQTSADSGRDRYFCIARSMRYLRLVRTKAQTSLFELLPSSKRTQRFTQPFESIRRPETRPSLLSSIRNSFHESSGRRTPDFEMAWQKSQHETFQIMWSTKPHNDCLPPLQVRSFTSDSYKAIKERERKRCQQKKAASTEWRSIPHNKPRRESSSLDATVDELWRAAEMGDDMYLLAARRSQSGTLEDCRVQDDGIQQNLGQPSAHPTGPVEIDCQGMTRCLDAFTSSASSPIALGSTSPGLMTDTELGSDSSQAMDSAQSSAFAHEVDMIVPVDVDTPVEELGSALLHKTASASSTSSHPTPTHSGVTGCNIESYEQPTQGGESASPRPASPQSNTVHVLATTTGPPQFALAKCLPNVQSYTCRDGHHRSRTYQAWFDQAGGIRNNRDSVAQALWTTELDEYLLHLRNVAQLRWEDLVNYFPTLTPVAVKRRHKQLSETKEMTQGADDQYLARFEERSTAAFPTVSTSGKSETKVTWISKVNGFVVPRTHTCYGATLMRAHTIPISSSTANIASRLEKVWAILCIFGIHRRFHFWLSSPQSNNITP